MSRSSYEIYQSIHAPSQSKQKRQQPKPVANNQVLQYYEENIILKQKQEKLQKQMQQLKNKLYVQVQLNKTYNQKQIKELAGGKKSTWCKKPTTYKASYVKSTSMQKGNNQTQHLLEIIDHYKQKLLTSEQEVKNLRRKKQLLQQDVQIKEKKANQIIQSYNNDSKADSTLAEKLRTNMRSLELEKQKNRYNQAEIKRLQGKLRMADLKNDDISNLKIENRKLQDQIRRLTSFTGSNTSGSDINQITSKMKQFQMKYQHQSQKNKGLKQSNISLSAQVKLLKEQLLQVNHQCDSLEKQNLKLKQQTMQNPIFEKLAKDPSLLMKVLQQIEKKNMDKSKQEKSFKDFQQIMIEKEQIAKQLIATQAKLKAIQQTWKQRQKLFKLQREEMSASLVKAQNQPLKIDQLKKETIRNGVHYDGDINVFTQEKITIPQDCNYFDLYIGEIHILQTMLKNMSVGHAHHSPHILATVDFYNHNTMHSKLAQGLSCDLQSQFSFKVSQDEFLFKYLNKGSLQIDIWIVQGNKNHHAGKVIIDLKNLIARSKPNIAPVIGSSSPIFLNDKVMGSVNYVMRMRLPIYQKAQRVNQLQHLLNFEHSEKVETRKLVIRIEQGRGFPQKANTFVYYPFRLQTFYTKPSKGSNPIWNHEKVLTMKYNDDLKNYIRKNDIEFVVFDDNALMGSDKSSDVVGTASISLISLLESKTLKQRLVVSKNGQQTGTIDIKIFWFDLENQKVTTRKELQAQKFTDPIEKIHHDINNYIQENHLTPQKVFQIIDQNKTGMVSFNQFYLWIIKLSKGITLEDANKFYETFKQPVNKLNFSMKIQQKLQKNTSNDLIAQFGAINKFFQDNTVQIKKKQKLQEYLKNKDLISLSLQIDKNQNGKISKAQLVQYLDNHNIEAEVPDEEIFLVQFLQKYKNKR